jgi:heterodisulfide reductase subunit C
MRTDRMNKDQHMAQEVLEPDYGFLDEIEGQGPFEAAACFQCRKCTNGCPVSFAMDLFPDEVIRLVMLGQRDRVLACRTIWVCAACETCTTRCPNGVRIAELMDALKEMALAEGVLPPVPEIPLLHRTFLASVHRRGRIFEPELLPLYRLQSGGLSKGRETWREDMILGLQMLLKGRMPMLPKGVKGKGEVRDILDHRRGRRS